MANGNVKIHDPFSNHNGGSAPESPESPESPSDSMEDSVEFRLLMAYAKRRLPQRKEASGGNDAGEPPITLQTPDKTEKKEKKRRKPGFKRFRKSFLSCIKPQTEDEETRSMNETIPNADNRCGPLSPHAGEEKEEEELKETASRLTKIADKIPFVPPDKETDMESNLESDSPEEAEGDMEKIIGLILREAGDRLNDSELKDAGIATELFWNYSFFKLLMTAVLTRMGIRSQRPDAPGPKASTEAQIAVACEITSRLANVNSLPRNRLLDHGARYLQHYYSSWAQQQGGYEEAFYSDDEDDDK